MKTLTLAAALVLALAFTAAAAPAADPPAEPVRVTNFGKKAAVTFDHKAHLARGLACAACHHTEAEGKYKCGECHLAEAAGPAPKLKDAMHKKGVGVCYQCHLARDAEHKFKCSDCHKG